MIEIDIFSEAALACAIFLVEDGGRCEIIGGALEILEVVVTDICAGATTPRAFKSVGLSVSQ